MDKQPFRSMIVTGASSGIGRGLAVHYAQQGVKVLAVARRASALQSLASEIPNIQPCVCDVDHTDLLVAKMREFDSQCDGVDVVIANAGVGVTKSHEPYAWEAIRDACHTNFCGAAATLTALLPGMVRRRSGHLVAISSISSLGPLPLSAAYCSPKAGLNMLMDCLRTDVGGHGIAVTNIRLGFVKTAMTEHSTHPMPWLLSVDQAVEHIVSAVALRAGNVDVPRPLAMTARIASVLPDAVHQWLLRKVRERL